MSPFLVYMMFQADAISALFGILAALTALASFILVCFACQSICSWENKEEVRAIKAKTARAAKVTIPAAVFLFAAALLFPSTKTIAAMVVLPKLTSPQALDAMGSEARDIYRLAKQALANIADDGGDKPAKSDK